MATFTSSKYPEITLQDDKGVWARFRGGRFETSDAGVAKRLRALPDGEGITEAGDPAPAAPDKAPAKSASKDTWVAWAVACGGRGVQADPRRPCGAVRGRRTEGVGAWCWLPRRTWRTGSAVT
ncbi:hypothetical protein [Streptomyces microflavus]|uniref:hypothetical protein n=1 Tax=Streptomyces microflavus TaxID=1919 RepID=UPI003B21A330